MDGRKGRVACRQHTSGIDEMRVLSGVVYMTKSRGPRTEPWGTSRARDKCVERRGCYCILHENSERTDRT